MSKSYTNALYKVVPARTCAAARSAQNDRDQSFVHIPKKHTNDKDYIKDRGQLATGIGNAEILRVKHLHLKCSLQGG